MRLAGLRQRALPGGRASLELLATRPPAVLLRSTYRRDRAVARPALARPSAGHAQARRTIMSADGRPWTCAGPLMLGEIERLRSAAVRLLLLVSAAAGRWRLHLLLPLGAAARGACARPRPRRTDPGRAAPAANLARARLWRDARDQRRSAAGDVRQSARLARHHRHDQRRRAWRGARRLLARLHASRSRLPRAARRARSARWRCCSLLAGRRADTRDPAARRPRDFARRRRRDQPGARARPLPLRFLRRLRLADGQLRRPQPRPGGRRAGPGRHRRASCCCAAPARSTCMALGEDVAASLGHPAAPLGARSRRPDRDRRRRLRRRSPARSASSAWSRRSSRGG